MVSSKETTAQCLALTRCSINVDMLLVISLLLLAEKYNSNNENKEKVC